MCSCLSRGASPDSEVGGAPGTPGTGGGAPGGPGPGLPRLGDPPGSAAPGL